MAAGFCDLYPSMPKAFCSHCHPTAMRAAGPVYPMYSTVRTVTDRYGELIEVLYFGGPVTVYDRHFRFGWRRARLIVESLAAVREFVAACEEGRFSLSTSTIQSPTFGSIAARFQGGFFHSSGDYIDGPFLQLEGADGTRKGFGYLKALAVIGVIEDLSRFSHDAREAQHSRVSCRFKIIFPKD